MNNLIQIINQVRNQIEYQVYEQIEIQVNYQIMQHIWHQSRNGKVWNEIENQIWDPI